MNFADFFGNFQITLLRRDIDKITLLLRKIAQRTLFIISRQLTVLLRLLRFSESDWFFHSTLFAHWSIKQQQLSLAQHLSPQPQRSQRLQNRRENPVKNLKVNFQARKPKENFVLKTLGQAFSTPRN